MEFLPAEDPGNCVANAGRSVANTVCKVSEITKMTTAQSASPPKTRLSVFPVTIHRDISNRKLRQWLLIFYLFSQIKRAVMFEKLLPKIKEIGEGEPSKRRCNHKEEEYRFVK